MTDFLTQRRGDEERERANRSSSAFSWRRGDFVVVEISPDLDATARRTKLAPMPIHYECQRCTACCRWPGLVKVGNAEIAALARFLELNERDFIERFTRLRPHRDGLALLEKPNGECIFLEGRDCMVQAVKPGQCAGFPNTWNFPGWRDVCEAVPVETR